jgi:hypothetical protein
MNHLDTEISISDLKKFWIPNTAQVIHCGAHLAEELDEYISNGFNNIVWIEAMPEIFTELQKRYRDWMEILRLTPAFGREQVKN